MGKGRGFDDDDDDDESDAPLAAQAQDNGALDLVSEKIDKLEKGVSQFESQMKQLGQSRDSQDHRSKMNSNKDRLKKEAVDCKDLLKKHDKDLAKDAKNKMLKELETCTSRMTDLFQQADVKMREHVLDKPTVEEKNAQADSALDDGITVSENVEAELNDERIADLKKVEKDMDTVVQIVDDVAAITDEQQEKYDTIEDNTKVAKENAKVAVVDLSDARSYQASARKKMVVIALGILGGLIGGGVAIYLAVK